MFVVLVTLYKSVYKVFNTILFASNCFARWKYWIERTEKKEIDNGDESLMLLSNFQHDWMHY